MGPHRHGTSGEGYEGERPDGRGHEGRRPDGHRYHQRHPPRGGNSPPSTSSTLRPTIDNGGMDRPNPLDHGGIGTKPRPSFTSSTSPHVVGVTFPSRRTPSTTMSPPKRTTSPSPGKGTTSPRHELTSSTKAVSFRTLRRHDYTPKLSGTTKALYDTDYDYDDNDIVEFFKGHGVLTAFLGGLLVVAVLIAFAVASYCIRRRYKYSNESTKRRLPPPSAAVISPHPKPSTSEYTGLSINQSPEQREYRRLTSSSQSNIYTTTARVGNPPYLPPGNGAPYVPPSMASQWSNPGYEEMGSNPSHRYLELLNGGYGSSVPDGYLRMSAYSTMGNDYPAIGNRTDQPPPAYSKEDNAVPLAPSSIQNLIKRYNQDGAPPMRDPRQAFNKSTQNPGHLSGLYDNASNAMPRDSDYTEINSDYHDYEDVVTR